MPNRRFDKPSPPVLVAAALALAFFVVPLVGLATQVSWSTITSDLGAPVALAALRLSLLCSLSATGVSVVLGLPLAWLIGRFSFRGRNVIQTITTLPMVMPPVVAGVALLSALGRHGTLGRTLFDVFGVQFTYRTVGVTVAEAFVAMPFLVVTMAGAFAGTDRRREEVAADLGAGRWMTFRLITLPAVRPSLVAGIALCWARALGEFGATLTFAGNIQGQTQTLPLAIELALQDDPPVAFALSALLVCVSALILIGLRGRLFEALLGGPR